MKEEKNSLKWQLREDLHKLMCGTLPAFLRSWFSIDRLGKRVLWALHCSYFDLNLQNMKNKTQNGQSPSPLKWANDWAYGTFFPTVSDVVASTHCQFINSSVTFPLIPQTPPSSYLPANLHFPPPPARRRESQKWWEGHFSSGFCSRQGMILQLPHKQLCKLFNSMENF